MKKAQKILDFILVFTFGTAAILSLTTFFIIFSMFSGEILRLMWILNASMWFFLALFFRNEVDKLLDLLNRSTKIMKIQRLALEVFLKRELEKQNHSKKRKKVGKSR